MHTKIEFARTRAANINTCVYCRRLPNACTRCAWGGRCARCCATRTPRQPAPNRVCRHVRRRKACGANARAAAACLSTCVRKACLSRHVCAQGVRCKCACSSGLSQHVCAQAQGVRCKCACGSGLSQHVCAQVPASTPARADDDAVYITCAPPDSVLSSDTVFIYGSKHAFADLFRTVRILGTTCPDPVAEQPALDALLPTPDAPWSARLHARLRTECPREAGLRAALCWLVDRVLVGHGARAGALEAVRDCGYLCGHLCDNSAPAEADVWDELDMAKKAAERGLHVRFRGGSGVAEHMCDRGFLLGLESVHWQCSGFVVYGQRQV